MPRYNVIATIQSTLPFSKEPPVEMKYATGTDLARAIVAAGQALTLDTDRWVRTLSVRIDVVEQDDPDVPLDGI